MKSHVARIFSKLNLRDRAQTGVIAVGNEDRAGIVHVLHIN